MCPPGYKLPDPPAGFESYTNNSCNHKEAESIDILQPSFEIGTQKESMSSIDSNENTSRAHGFELNNKTSRNIISADNLPKACQHKLSQFRNSQSDFRKTSSASSKTYSEFVSRQESFPDNSNKMMYHPGSYAPSNEEYNDRHDHIRTIEAMLENDITLVFEAEKNDDIHCFKKNTHTAKEAQCLSSSTEKRNQQSYQFRCNVSYAAEMSELRLKKAQKKAQRQMQITLKKMNAQKEYIDVLEGERQRQIEEEQKLLEMLEPLSSSASIIPFKSDIFVRIKNKQEVPKTLRNKPIAINSFKVTKAPVSQFKSTIVVNPADIPFQFESELYTGYRPILNSQGKNDLKRVSDSLLGRLDPLRTKRKHVRGEKLWMRCKQLRFKKNI